MILADIEEIMAKLPGKDCGLCGFKTCKEFAEYVAKNPDEIKRCIYLEGNNIQPIPELKEKDITWKDILDREYDFVLDKFPGDPGPKEVILLSNPAKLEKLKIKKGDILYGRPALGTGCPVTHCGVVIEEPDFFNGTIFGA